MDSVSTPSFPPTAQPFTEFVRWAPMPQDPSKPAHFDDCSDQVIGACIEVHRHLGSGLLESAYEECLCHELTLRGLPFRRQQMLPAFYKGIELAHAYRLDLVVRDELVIELKAVERLTGIHQAQVITYLKMSGYGVGLLVNFHEPTLRTGLKRLYRPKE